MPSKLADIPLPFTFLAFLALVLSSARASDEVTYRFPREQRDVSLKEFAPGWEWGIQLAASGERVEHEGPATKDSKIDGVDLELSGELTDWLSIELDTAYEFDGPDRYEVEEVFANIELGDDDAWVIEVGRMELPTGEFNSNFLESSPIETIAETFDGAVLLAYESETFELSLGGYKGTLHSKNPVVAVNITQFDNIEFGFYWTGNIGESLELRSLQIEALSEDEEDELQPRRVAGTGGYVAWSLEPFILDFEYAIALETFSEGILDDAPLRPSAWNLELSTVAFERWQFATKLEHSSELPESPKWQYGVAVSLGITPNLTLTTNYLIGDFKDRSPDRKLFQAEMVFEY